MYTLVVQRYFKEMPPCVFNTMDEALRSAYYDIENNSSFPKDLYEDGKLIYSDSGLAPLDENGQAPPSLRIAIREWAERNIVE